MPRIACPGACVVPAASAALDLNGPAEVRTLDVRANDSRGPLRFIPGHQTPEQLGRGVRGSAWSCHADHPSWANTQCVAGEPMIRRERDRALARATNAARTGRPTNRTSCRLDPGLGPTRRVSNGDARAAMSRLSSFVRAPTTPGGDRRGVPGAYESGRRAPPTRSPMRSSGRRLSPGRSNAA